MEVVFFTFITFLWSLLCFICLCSYLMMAKGILTWKLYSGPCFETCPTVVQNGFSDGWFQKWGTARPKLRHFASWEYHITIHNWCEFGNNQTHILTNLTNLTWNVIYPSQMNNYSSLITASYNIWEIKSSLFWSEPRPSGCAFNLCACI